MSAPAITIRQASSGDIPSLLSLDRQTSTSAHWSELQYRRLFAVENHNRLIVVAELKGNGPIVGFLVAQHVPPEWELENVVVAADSQRGGIGRLLLQRLLAEARNSNSEAVFLEVRESNSAARGLYERAGFEPTGRRKAYYANPTEDAVLYRYVVG